MTTTADIIARVGVRTSGPWNRLRTPRLGIMLHYDESASDVGSLQWLLTDPACNVSYNWIILDRGEQVTIAPAEARAWHAGVCQPSDTRLRYADANSAFYGVAVAANHKEIATAEQFTAVVELCASLFRAQKWSAGETWRIVAHRTEAWPRGRKDDPDGKLGVVLSVDKVREAVTRELMPI